MLCVPLTALVYRYTRANRDLCGRLRKSTRRYEGTRRDPVGTRRDQRVREGTRKDEKGRKIAYDDCGGGGGGVGPMPEIDYGLYSYVCAGGPLSGHASRRVLYYSLPLVYGYLLHGFATRLPGRNNRVNG